MGKSSGKTTPGHTGWKQQSKNLIYADVNHDDAADPPAYYSTALQGEASSSQAEYFLTHGGNMVYNPTKKGMFFAC
jgi:hypothetical protein